jgi:hypothetical protein
VAVKARAGAPPTPRLCCVHDAFPERVRAGRCAGVALDRGIGLRPPWLVMGRPEGCLGSASWGGLGWAATAGEGGFFRVGVMEDAKIQLLFGGVTVGLDPDDPADRGVVLDKPMGRS